MNRWDFLKINLPKYLENSYINEIVISDENGADAAKIRDTFTDPKIKIYTNTVRLGAFRNKEEVVRLASNDWVVLMDSDNFAPISYFEHWAKCVIESNIQENIVYAPSRTIPTSNHSGFDYRSFIGKELTKDTYRSLTSNKMLECVINTGNYIVNKDFYLRAIDPAYKSIYEQNIGLDVKLKTYFHLANGAVFVFPAGMEYEHIVHPGSLYTTTAHNIPTYGHILDGLYRSFS